MWANDQTIDLSAANWSKGEGLLPAIIQDNATGKVLMLGFMNEEALQKTIDTEFVTFFSRTKQALWQKGETSGNVLKVISLQIDCDQDTFLIKAEPAGPVCHKGSDTCFDEVNEPSAIWLDVLEDVIAQRKLSADEDSYTASLFAKGVKRIAQKVGEEGVEVALAGAIGDQDEIKEEAADLLYHLLVLLNASELKLSDVVSELQKRHQSR